MNVNKVFLLLFLSVSFFIVNSAFSQGGTWTWISGDSTFNSPGVYGTQGVPSIYNHPPGDYEYTEWKDKQGNFWVYGGTYPSPMNDLWKFNPFTREWTWMNGDSELNASPIYGTQGIGSPINNPGAITYCATSWVDSSDGLWLFGGILITGGVRETNDLWKYDIATNSWIWMNGNHSSKGNHGTIGIANPSNVPGGRMEGASGWTDSLNNLWLFGGDGVDDNSNDGLLNDLMKYSVSNNEWTWMNGSAFRNAVANYGIKRVSNATNDPGGRDTYTKWKDKQGNFWIFGGNPNDMWKYDPGNNEWTWMNGIKTYNDPGTYGTPCVFDTSYLPAYRLEQRSSVTDNCGRFWLFGGYESNGNGYGFNDLWLFDPQLVQWKWLSGNSTSNQPGNYGVLGEASPSNMPPSRCGAVAWWGNDNKFYLFGGMTDNWNGLSLSDVWVFAPDTNCVHGCGAALALPVANFQSNKTTLCANDCINFTDLSANTTSWQWSFAGATDSISTAQQPQNIYYSKVGIYNVKLIAYNAGGSDTLTLTNYITVYPAPPTPTIKQLHDTLFFSADSSYTSYQWYLDSTKINGATDTLLVFTQGGNYNVKVTNNNGCVIGVGITVVGIKEFSQNNYISLSPNPATNELLISGNWQATGKLTIFNVLGEIIYSDAINRKRETINCKPFPAGIYFVQITTEKERWVGRFVKE